MNYPTMFAQRCKHSGQELHALTATVMQTHNLEHSAWVQVPQPGTAVLSVLFPATVSLIRVQPDNVIWYL